MTDTVKKQRDLFLAFALASADLLIEVSEQAVIKTVIGAPQLLTGIKESELIGENWLNIFSAYDRAQLEKLRKNSIEGKRCGPILVEINGPKITRKSVFTGMRMPNDKAFYITLGLSNKMMSKIAQDTDFTSTKKELSNEYDFKLEAEKALDFARSIGEEPDITLFDFGFTQEIKEEFNDEQWGAFQEELTHFLQSQSLNNSNPAKFDNSKYGIVHAESPEDIIAKAKEIAEKHLPLETGYTFKEETVQADLSKIGDWGAEKALDYLVTGFSAQDNKQDTAGITTLSQSIEANTKTQKSAIDELKSMIERVDFSLQFQPIQNFETEQPLHYEIIPKFNNGDTRKWRMLAEDADLTFDLDLAYCERVINHINFKSGGSRTKFSAALFNKSIQTPLFLEKLSEQLDKAKGIGERLCFELRHYSDIVDTKTAINAISKLKERGHEICIGSSSLTPNIFTQLNTYDIDFIKIGNKSIHDLTNNKRTQSNLKDFVKAGTKYAISIIADNITNEEQAGILKELGVQNAQGPYIGEISDKVAFQPTQK